MSDKFEKLIEQNSEQLAELYKISSKLNGHYIDMDTKLKAHFEDDKQHFDEFRIMLVDIQGSLDSLQGVSDFFKGAGLLKKPMTIILAFIIGIVALLGGLKSLLLFFIPTKL